jgi:hypothetical protein
MAAVFSSIVLVALLFNMWVLNATAVEEPSRAPKMQADAHFVLEEKKQSWVKRLYDDVLSTGTATAAIPATEFAEDLSPKRFGKPVAYVNMDGLYLISKTGRILCSADSCDYIDLPIISSDSFELDDEGVRLIDSGTKDALILLAHIQKNYALKPILSEIKVKGENLIAYMNLGDVMPVMFGRGAWDEKINNFISYQKQLGATELTRQAVYLDLRVENRIIVKKSV